MTEIAAPRSWNSSGTVASGTVVLAFGAASDVDGPELGDEAGLVGALVDSAVTAAVTAAVPVSGSAPSCPLQDASAAATTSSSTQPRRPLARLGSDRLMVTRRPPD